MICPCKGCERAGCGEHHSQCQPYQDWKAEQEDKRKWLRSFAPVVSERQRWLRVQRIRKDAKGWHREHNGGDG